MIQKEPKGNPWPFYTPGYFKVRSWTKSKMLPVTFNTALKKRENYSKLYFFCTLAVFNWFAYEYFKNTNSPSSNESVDIMKKARDVSPDKNQVLQLYSFEGMKLKSLDSFENETMESR